MNEVSSHSSNDKQSLHGRKRSKLSQLFSCCRSSRLGNSVHFSAPAEDSVHVMLKHDIEKNLKKGVQAKGYSPRTPLSDILAAHQQQNRGPAIQAMEDDNQILANITNADRANRGSSQ
ncbi:hypothetical protein HJC23_010055 [Cyclotella cryptica]|uniref:Uncharacterized protein n=1 Tax=Cyclotella cryptica TaxID=29204 RepID=A0ABD3Q3J2_9STRA|eukprot:CCRYP_009034-RA/>CCRYP_009034-RA protein AED:0.33 eAED:0.33 QI:0/-1/0/1/-1/1/1/0/117